MLRDELAQGKSRDADATKPRIRLPHMNSVMQATERQLMIGALGELTFQHRTVLCSLLQFSEPTTVKSVSGSVVGSANC